MWAHQQEGMQRGLRSPDFMYAFEMGTGKTRTVIEVLRRRYAENNRMLKTLILCPVIVCDNWKREFAMYSKVNPNDILVLTGSAKQRVKRLLDATGDDMRYPKIVVTNYQGMLMPELYGILKQWGIEVLVCDESQRLKSHESKTAKLVAHLSDDVRHRYLLTGTPILNSPADIFMQYRILDGGATFGKNFYTFRAKYFRDDNDAFKGKQHYFPKWEPRLDMIGELQAKIEAKSMRVLAKDCIDLPELVVQDVEVPLSREQLRMYEEMKQDFLTYLKDKEGKMSAVVAEMAVTKAMRMQQIVTGFAKDDEHKVHQIEDVPRLEMLEELLTSITANGSKVIVWSIYHENYKAIAKLCEKLGLKYVELHGGIDPKARIELMDTFRTDPTVQVAICNQKAAGIGVNLIEAQYSIYYSRGYSLEDELQSSTRNFRGGSAELFKTVFRINLVAKGTIDDVINEALSKKLKVSQAILDNKGRL